MLAVESHYRCVYCAIHEARMGGTRCFHVEHYRPKSRFAQLENRFENLFYSCPICNVFKGDDWPCEPATDHSTAAYPDPSAIDYSHILSVDKTSMSVSSDRVAGKYMIERLFLNRPQLIRERRLAAIQERARAMRGMAKALVAELATAPTLGRLVTGLLAAIVEVDEMLDELVSDRPYAPKDVQR